MTITNMLLVGAGGFAGSVARYLTASALERKLDGVFPYGTLTVNIVGSFLLGCLLGWVAAKPGSNSGQWRLLLGTGFCGGFTTFSAFAFENFNLIEQRHISTSLLYSLLSIGAGLLAVWIGYAVSRTIFGGQY